MQDVCQADVSKQTQVCQNRHMCVKADPLYPNVHTLQESYLTHHANAMRHGMKATIPERPGVSPNPSGTLLVNWFNHSPTRGRLVQPPNESL